ncbi:MAG: citrate synthase [Acidimicrobiia bacterium]|nr:citrate synthase [Acidimicrobiia bacterium]
MSLPPPISGDRQLTAKEAAARLGVKVETLYAYVSRGMLDRRRAVDGRASMFSAADIDRLANRNRRTADRGGLEMIIDTHLTSIDDHRVRYRGHDAVDLAHHQPFEAVAEWLWLGDDARREFTPWASSVKSAELIADEVAGLPSSATAGDRLRVAVAVAGATHSLRHDLRPTGVAHSGRRLIATMVDSLPLRQGRPPMALVVDGEELPESIAERLWPRLGPEPASPELIAALNAALVLLADHELAASTLAARVAASTRADPYAVVSSGLGVLSGSLHGTASVPVQRLLAEVARAGATDIDHVGAIVSDHLRHSRFVPGFGHPLYPDGDPRAVALIDLVRASAGRADRMDVIDAVAEVMTEGAPVPPNVDFGLAALAHLSGFDIGAGEAIFAVARAAGWIAHAIEEYSEIGNRFRARARYVGDSGGA